MEQGDCLRVKGLCHLLHLAITVADSHLKISLFFNTFAPNWSNPASGTILTCNMPVIIPTPERKMGTDIAVGPHFRRVMRSASLARGDHRPGVCLGIGLKGCCQDCSGLGQGLPSRLWFLVSEARRSLSRVPGCGLWNPVRRLVSCFRPNPSSEPSDQC